MNQMDHALEYSEVIVCMWSLLMASSFVFVVLVGFMFVCTCCFNPAFTKGQEMEHIKPSLPQFLHPLMCVFSVSSTVISAVSVALGSAESLTYWEELLVLSFLSQLLLPDLFLSLFLSVTWSACISLLIYPSVLFWISPPLLHASSHSLKLSSPCFLPAQSHFLLSFRFSSLNEYFYSSCSLFMLSFWCCVSLSHSVCLCLFSSSSVSLYFSVWQLFAASLWVSEGVCLWFLYCVFERFGVCLGFSD